MLIGAPSTIGSVYVFSLTGHDCNENTIFDACDIVNGTSEDANGNGVPDECEPCLPADLDNCRSPTRMSQAIRSSLVRSELGDEMKKHAGPLA